MKPYFAKFLPTEGEITKSCKAFDSKGILQTLSDNPVLNKLKDWKLAKLYLCSRDIKVGDKCLHPWDGGVKGSREGTLQWNVKLEDLEEENLHVILDLNYDPKYEPYAIRTDKGFGWRNNKTGEQAYIKVIGQISPNAIWVTEGMKFDKDELMWSIFDDYGLDEIDRCNFNELKEPSEFDKIIIRCPTCKIFH